MGTLRARIEFGFWRLLAPQRCLACREALCSPRQLCAACRDGLIPSEVAVDSRSPWTRWRYRGTAGVLVRRFKLDRCFGTGAWLARDLARAFPLERRPAKAQVCVPVPLSARRQRERGFNQAEFLAERVAMRLSARLLPRALLRIRETAVQGRSLDRRANLRDAFVPGPQARLLAGRRVLLIDDVVTSGATLDACRAVLEGLGVADLQTVCLCRARPSPLEAS